MTPTGGCSALLRPIRPAIFQYVPGVLQYVAVCCMQVCCNMLQCVAVCCSMLPASVLYASVLKFVKVCCSTPSNICTRCVCVETSFYHALFLGTRQHCNRLQHAESYCNTLKDTATQRHSKGVPRVISRTATPRCNTVLVLQHTAT